MARRVPALLAAGVAVLSSCQAASAQTTGDMHDGCVHMKIVHSTNEAVFTKRAVELSLANRSDVAYYAQLNFGTPPQPQFVQIDTGSFELWVNPTCAGLSSGDMSFCQAVGNFNTSQSSTFSSMDTSKQLRYGIGSANITYVKDDITLPGTTSVMEQVQFGVAASTIDEFSGILGIGYGEGLATRYPNFVDELQTQNITKVKAFSLALGSKDEQEGVLVFGGVDTSKFAGGLTRLPITPAQSSPDGVPRYWVNMSSMSLATGSGSAKQYTNSSLQVFLDSGSTLTLLPSSLANSVAADFGATDGPNEDGFYAVDCSLARSASTLDVSFSSGSNTGSITVRVPFRELVRQSGSQCMLGIQANSDFALLGDTFMRSAYVVIDQEDNAVWMAQYVNCGSTPAALATTASLVTLTGTCASQNNVNDAVSASPSTSSSTSSTASPSSHSPSSSSSGSSSSSAVTQTVSPQSSSPSSQSSEVPINSDITTTSASTRTSIPWLLLVAMAGQILRRNLS